MVDVVVATRVGVDHRARPKLHTTLSGGRIKLDRSEARAFNVNKADFRIFEQWRLSCKIIKFPY